MITDRPKTKNEIQNKERCKYKRFMRRFDKWFPPIMDPVPFDKRFELIVKGGEGVTEPSEMRHRGISPRNAYHHSHTQHAYSPPRGGEKIHVSRPWDSWGSGGVVFRHPRIPYEYDWLHTINGDFCSSYIHTSLKGEHGEVADYTKGCTPDKYNWSEYRQYESDIDSLRLPINRTSAHVFNVSGGGNLQTRLEREVSMGNPGLSAVDLCALSFDDAVEKLGPCPTFVNREIKHIPAHHGIGLVSYVFYDVLRRGVYFHLYTTQQVLATYVENMDEDYGENAEKYWERNNNRTTTLVRKLGKSPQPFLLTVNASTTNIDLNARERYELTSYLRKISIQYLSFFGKWLKHRFEPASQIQYSMVYDAFSPDVTSTQKSATTVVRLELPGFQLSKQR